MISNHSVVFLHPRLLHVNLKKNPFKAGIYHTSLLRKSPRLLIIGKPHCMILSIETYVTHHHHIQYVMTNISSILQQIVVKLFCKFHGLKHVQKEQTG